MARKPRSYLSHLSAEWQRQHPLRPAKYDFNDELLVAVAFIMRQIDPDGTRPIIEPPMPAEGYEVQPSVIPSSKRGRPRE
ncbi:hypothetical protein [Zavarzinella formosa]|uniref:hypothetical protein n=1 Tax=Zavarzinella formosa TaxID=360055 RepID=UPI00037E7027|nr:hypothetical protein [Zavarzinella formosa]